MATITTSFTVTNETGLNNALAAIDLTGASSAPNTAYTITFGPGLTGAKAVALTSDLDAINLATGDTLMINGNGGTLDGEGAQRGLLVYSGAVAVNDLAITDTVAQGGVGGAGHAGGGGGAGLGGGLFVVSGASVSLNSVTFVGDSAAGGTGGLGDVASAGGGGGGGLGGSGASGSTLDASGYGGGGGGGVGVGASGGTTSGPAPGSGILLGADSGAANGGADGGGGSEQNDRFGGGGGGPDGTSQAGPGGGAGGFGGGGGGGSYDGSNFQGGNGGFGGGGGGGGSGDGGFGGGGGGEGINGDGSSVGGFGAGAGGSENGGGGLGAGGGIFVEQGGTLSFGSGDVSGNTVVAGQGGSGGGLAGSAFGSGIFIQGGQSITFDPATGKTATVADVIADQTGSGGTGTNAGAGSVDVAGAGTVLFSAANTYTGGTTLAAGSTLELGNAAAAGSGAITFDGTATLAIDSGASLPNTIAGLGLGDRIDFADLVYATGGSASVDGLDQLMVTEASNTATLQLAGDVSGLAFSLSADATGGTLVTVEAPCYCPGTLIETDRGEVPVEDLQPGDLVRTVSGALRPIRWIGRRRATLGLDPARDADMQPIRILASACGDGLPRRDLFVSPQHCLFLDGVLVPARLLVNDRTIRQEQRDRVKYFHVELDSHDVLLAEGLPAESYLDTGNRSMFSNAPIVALRHDFSDDVARLAASEPYAEVVVAAGVRLDQIRERLERLSLASSVDEITSQETSTRVVSAI